MRVCDLAALKLVVQEERRGADAGVSHAGERRMGSEEERLARAKEQQLHPGRASVRASSRLAIALKE